MLAGLHGSDQAPPQLQKQLEPVGLYKCEPLWDFHTTGHIWTGTSGQETVTCPAHALAQHKFQLPWRWDCRATLSQHWNEEISELCLIKHSLGKSLLLLNTASKEKG